MAMKLVKSTKQIMGLEPATGSEWDAGYLHAACLHRAVRVTVRKDADGLWTVFALGRKGDKVLATHNLAVFRCETCAKAFALCIVHGVDYAVCEIHDRDGFSDADIFDATVKVLLSLMGIGENDWATLDEGSRHRVIWTVREIFDGQKEWGKVIRAWESAESKGLPIGLTIRVWHSALALRQ